MNSTLPHLGSQLIRETEAAPTWMLDCALLLHGLDSIISRDTPNSEVLSL